MEDSSKSGRPMTPKRQKILDKAFAQLRKARGEMDPKLLSKIRRMIAGSPEMMKSLGVTESLEPAPVNKHPEKISRPVEAPRVPPAQKPAKEVESHEAVDQAKNMEVMAKLMALNPDNKERIKSAIKKAEK